MFILLKTENLLRLTNVQVMTRCQGQQVSTTANNYVITIDIVTNIERSNLKHCQKLYAFTI